MIRAVQERNTMAPTADPPWTPRNASGGIDSCGNSAVTAKKRSKNDVITAGVAVFFMAKKNAKKVSNHSKCIASIVLLVLSWWFWLGKSTNLGILRAWESQRAHIVAENLFKKNRLSFRIERCGRGPESIVPKNLLSCPCIITPK